MNHVIIDGESITLQDVVNVAHQGYDVSLSPLAIERIQRSRNSKEFVNKSTIDNRFKANKSTL